MPSHRSICNLNIPPTPHPRATHRAFEFLDFSAQIPLPRFQKALRGRRVSNARGVPEEGGRCRGYKLSAALQYNLVRLVNLCAPIIILRMRT